jgi:hypothetical protein
VRRDFETNYWTQGCGAATEKRYVSPFGDVLACSHMHIAFGNVRETRLADIRARMLEDPFLRDFHPRCLTAEDREFIDNHLPRELLQDRPLPRAEAVFANLPQPRPAGR